MKLQVRQIDSFIAGGAEKVAAVLFYGPDTGLVRERADMLAKKVVADLDDPFSVSLLSQDAILDDPALLADDLGAMSLGGGAAPGYRRRRQRADDQSGRKRPGLGEPVVASDTEGR